jgi:putative transcriptional regulator
MRADVSGVSSWTPGEVVRLPGPTPGLIRDLRARLGLTQEKFAARLGVTFPTINRWENGRAKPSPLALRQIQMLAQELESLTASPPRLSPGGHA